MNTTPDLVKKHLLRFYATFTSITQPPDADLFAIRLKTWADAFATTPADTFSQACQMCSMSQSRHPTPADVFEFMLVVQQTNKAQQLNSSATT